jgi:hypothetical protein
MIFGHDWKMESPEGLPRSENRSRLKFFLAGASLPVGYFEESNYPKVAEPYRYMPYRSLAHDRLVTALGRGEIPRCSYVVDGTEVSFAIHQGPGHKVLELRDFEFDPNESRQLQNRSDSNESSPTSKP